MAHQEIEIAGRRIGQQHSPYIIAELSANHHGKFEHALKLLEVAKEAGADAVKLQSYTADTITLDSQNPDFQIDQGPWKGRSLHELYTWAHMPWEWHEPLFRRAAALGITLFSTPFDPTAVDLLEELGAPAYKVASFEAVDLPLIRRIAKTQKPMIISTGMAGFEEIEEAVQVARQYGSGQLVLLHCVSGYPAPAGDFNLRTLQHLAEALDVIVGLSDHNLSSVMACASVALGASVIEKHLTLDRSAGGPDDAFSIEPHELQNLCRDAAMTWEALGRVDYSLKSSERGNLQFRRSLYAVEDIAAGELLSEQNVRSIRPGFGLAPKYFDEVIGRRACRSIAKGTALDWSLIDTKR